MTIVQTCRNRASGPRLAKALLCVGFLAVVLVLLPPHQEAHCLPAAAAPIAARSGRYNRRMPPVQQQANLQNPLGLPHELPFDHGSPSSASPSSTANANGGPSGSANTLSLALYPKRFFAGPPTSIELDPVLPPPVLESASPSPNEATSEPMMRHSVCITLTDPLRVVHSAKLVGATHSAKLYAQPGCMADDAGFILDPNTGKPVKAEGAALSLAAPGHYLRLRKGKGFSGPVRSVRLCSEKEKEKCH